MTAWTLGPLTINPHWAINPSVVMALLAFLTTALNFQFAGVSSTGLTGGFLAVALAFLKWETDSYQKANPGASVPTVV